MKQPFTPLPAGYFHALYSANADPWNLANSEYERRKCQATLDALPARRYHHAFEIGCAIGVLTRLLAARVDHLLSVDMEDIALDQARVNCEGVANVRFERMVVPAAWPDRRFDLILLSEVLYYFSPDDIQHTAKKTRQSASEDAVVVLVHWTHPTDLPLSGDDATELFLTSVGPDLSPICQIRTADYRIDVLSSVARPDRR